MWNYYRHKYYLKLIIHFVNEIHEQRKQHHCIKLIYKDEYHNNNNVYSIDNHQILVS